MKVESYMHEDYNEVYTSDPASAAGRIQAIEITLRGKVTFVTPVTTTKEDILKVHTPRTLKTPNVKAYTKFPRSLLAAQSLRRKSV